MTNHRKTACAVAALLAAAGAARAADLPASSRIAKVVVHPSGAEVTRDIDVTLPGGTSTIVLRG
ncbi:MAG: hypothetical protein KGQ28_04725, partial [Hyphomicrobiales bacterium]|nr:hypothetical protein [Hyphomicrobiales bacterium]